MANFKRALKTARVRADLGHDVQLPLRCDFIRCPRCLVSVDHFTDLTGMDVFREDYVFREEVKRRGGLFEDEDEDEEDSLSPSF